MIENTPIPIQRLAPYLRDTVYSPEITAPLYDYINRGVWVSEIGDLTAAVIVCALVALTISFSPKTSMKETQAQQTHCPSCCD